MNPTRPTLIYDGDCKFCIRWIRRWKHVTRDRVEYLASGEAAARFPQITAGRFDRSVQLVDPGGAVYEGAEAVFRTLAYAPRRGGALWMYRRIPGFAPVAEWVYRKVAQNRVVLGAITCGWLGEEKAASTYFLSRRVFLILLGFIYFCAFGSLWLQLDGLLGSQGVLPAAEFLEHVKRQVEGGLFFKVPTLFWVDAGDGFLNGVCLAGMALAAGLTAGFGSAPVLALLWFLYLSFINVGQVFLAFQWDTLLLEVGFLAIFLAPWKLRSTPDTEPPPSMPVLWLYRFLLFRLIFSSGMVKWLSGDAAWRSMTALQYHYETQPLPTWVGWYMHQLPAGFQTFSVGGVFFFQLVVPFFVFLPRRRHTACALLIGFQVLILLTGNYCFFNLLAIALCLLQLDDSIWRRLLPERRVARVQGSVPREKDFSVKGWLTGMAGVLILFLSVMMFLVQMGFSNFIPPRFALDLFAGVRPFHITSSYGLFAVMTTSRPEIVIEGSEDGSDWRAYEFKWKPGNPTRAPAFVAPHQPRLDWQMWFAALGTYERNLWFLRLVGRLLSGAEPVLNLLAYNPFPDKPPRFIRAILYDYRFTDFAGWRKDTSFWKRKQIGIYLPPTQLPRR